MTTLIVKLLTGALLFNMCVTTVAHAAGVEEVPVTSMGFGGSPAEAIQDAIVNAVAQINGEAVASSMKLKEVSSSSVSSNGQASREISREMKETISRKTKGVVASWSVISQEKTDAEDYSAKVSARIARLQRSAQLNRMKIAVVWSQKGDAELSSKLEESLAMQLTSSRKFALIDRKNNAAIQGQLNRIRRGEGRVADQVRLTGAEVPDYLAVVDVESERKSGSKLYAFGSLQIIDYSSRQVKFAERKTMVLDADKPATTPIRLNVLAKSLSRAVVESVYPPTVVAVTDKDLTIGQGKDFFSKGDEVVVFELGQALKDAATGEFLSRERNEVGKAVISYVDARISKATLSESIKFNLRLISQNGYVVTRTGKTQYDEDEAAPAAGSTSKKKKSNSVSNLLDD
jgi:hypothetical protein